MLTPCVVVVLLIVYVGCCCYDGSRQFPSSSYHHETDMETLARNYGEIVSLKPDILEI